MDTTHSKKNDEIVLKTSNILKIAQDIIVDDKKIVIIINSCESIVIKKQLLSNNRNFTFA